jgi:uridine phosphorylase
MGRIQGCDFPSGTGPKLARSMAPLHLRPKTPYAPDALLPGDPGRAMALAQQLVTEPKMSNHNRGLWGYTGRTAEGRPLTVQSTGIGGPSAALVLQELAELGVRRAIRVGTCGALDEELGLGDLLCAEAALTEDGTSVALGADGRALPDPALLERLRERAEPVTVATTDLFYEADGTARERWIAAGARAVEMEAATLFALGARLGVAVGCLLVVSDVFPGGERRRIGPEDLEEAVERMGQAALEALEASDEP